MADLLAEKNVFSSQKFDFQPFVDVAAQNFSINLGSLMILTSSGVVWKVEVGEEVMSSLHSEHLFRIIDKYDLSSLHDFVRPETAT